MKKEELIYNLIFSIDSEFTINLNKYIVDLYDYEDFIKEIKDILIKSKVLLIEDDINVNEKGNIIWNIKIKK
jgi:dihydroneopterin aldolase